MIRNTTDSYGLATILFHWIMAGLFFVQFWLGLDLSGAPDKATKAAQVGGHMSLGFLILALWCLRLVWFVFNRRPALPEKMSKSEVGIARAVHMLLFVSLAVTPVAGWAVLSASGVPLSMFSLVPVPPLPVATSVLAVGLWTTLHAFLAFAMLFLTFVHALAAIRHQFTLKDGLLKRMILPGSKLTD